jgi:transcriptional regulator with XRE-family HTH domain
MAPLLAVAKRGTLGADELQRFLSTTATTPERVNGLMALGLRVEDIAGCAGVSPSAVRNWSTGQAEPRRDPAITLDDLRTTAKALLDGGMEAPRVARWLTSRDPQRFKNERPLDCVSTDPIEVIKVAMDEILEEMIAATQDSNGLGAARVPR